MFLNTNKLSILKYIYIYKIPSVTRFKILMEIHYFVTKVSKSQKNFKPKKSSRADDLWWLGLWIVGNIFDFRGFWERPL